MRHSDLIESIDESLALLLDVASEYVDEIAEELAVVASPEKLLGKSYSDWNKTDLELLAQVYGEGDDTPLAKVVFNKEYEKVLNLEEGEL